MRISDWSSDVCSSDLTFALPNPQSPIPNPCCSGAAAMTRFVVIVLVIANVVTAIGVVSARHEHRQLFVQLARLEHARDALNIDFGRLPLAQATWAAEIGRASRRERE